MPSARLTAMMQADQEKAMRAVKQYETALQSLIKQHNGELLQTYANGVNIASRVEGVTGALLVSSNTRQQVNQLKN